MTSLIKHLHAFIGEVELTEAEWMTGLRFLTEVGQKCDDQRQEFILLSDVLGASILVDAISHRKLAGGTESTVFGPFWVAGAAELSNGASIARGEEAETGELTVVHSRWLTPKARPSEGQCSMSGKPPPTGSKTYRTQHSRT
jgi:catechol 1,2-dioxygenase